MDECTKLFQHKAASQELHIRHRLTAGSEMQVQVSDDSVPLATADKQP